jgi:hypothetical protein
VPAWQCLRVNLEIYELRPASLIVLSPYTNMQWVRAWPTVKRAGANCPGSCRSALVHPLDIAAAAVAGLTTLAASGWTVRYVASDERTPDEVTQVLGAAIG